MSQKYRSHFEECALASGLLSEQQLDEARAGVRWSDGDEPDPNSPPSDKQLAHRLVEIGLLNVWQVKQLRNGRTKFTLGPYQIVDSVGQGGMGHVFKARNGKEGPYVAIKVLPHDKTTPEAVLSFAREIHAASKLSHPKLVTAIDAGQDGNAQYLVTEYVPGMDLRKLVRQVGPLSMDAAASIICQVAEALQYAHDQGLVHRDVKPGNVLVTPQGEAKLSDLGLAESLLAERDKGPRGGKIVGTVDYLSPDQVQNPRQPTPAWDIYSLGCTLYLAVTGKVPFPGGSTTDKARAHCELRPMNPRRLNPNLSTEFIDVMADMMAKDPGQRTASGGDVIVRLTPFLPSPAKAANGFTNGGRSLPTPPGSSPASPPPGSSVPLAPITVPPPSSRRVLTPLEKESQRVISWPPTDTEISHSESLVGLNIMHGASQRLGPIDLSLLDEDELPSMEVPIRARQNLSTTFWPLMLILVPLALLGAVLLAWWIVQWMWPG